MAGITLYITGTILKFDTYSFTGIDLTIPMKSPCKGIGHSSKKSKENAIYHGIPLTAGLTVITFF